MELLLILGPWIIAFAYWLVVAPWRTGRNDRSRRQDRLRQRTEREADSARAREARRERDGRRGFAGILEPDLEAARYHAEQGFDPDLTGWRPITDPDRLAQLQALARHTNLLPAGIRMVPGADGGPWFERINPDLPLTDSEVDQILDRPYVPGRWLSPVDRQRLALGAP